MTEQDGSTTPSAGPIPSRTFSAPENPLFGGREVLQIGMLMFVLPVIVLPFVVVLVRTIWYPHLSTQAVAEKPWVVLGPQFVWFTMIALFLMDYARAKFHQSLWQLISWNWPSNGWLPLVGIGIATLGLQVLQRVLPMPQTSPFDKFFQRPVDGFALAILGIAFAPFMEELFFRGLLYPVIARRWGVATGVLATAGLFGVIHYPEYKSWSPVLIIFLVGVILGWVRAQRRSVAASFVVHAIYNGVPIIALMIASRGFQHVDRLTR